MAESVESSGRNTVDGTDSSAAPRSAAHSRAKVLSYKNEE